MDFSGSCRRFCYKLTKTWVHAVQREPNSFVQSSLLPAGLLKSCWKIGQWPVGCAGSSPSQMPLSRNIQRFAQRSCKAPPPENPQPGKMGTYRSFVKPILFTAFVGVGSVTACTIWQYEVYRSTLKGENRSFSQLLRLSSPPFGEKRGELRQKLNEWWGNIPPGEQIFWPICAINALVFMAWKIPAFSPFLVKWFSTNPYSRAVALPMLLSVFSHYSLFHLAANMFVLHSFTPSATHILGREQFVGMYLTSGVVASLGSHFHKMYIRSAVPSLGASGAIMGILGLVCSNMPNIPLGIIFIPNFSFSADTALKCIIAIDSTGVLLGWRFFDHAAHLSGCLFGVAFNQYAAGPLNQFRDMVTEHWHRYRNKSDGRR